MLPLRRAIAFVCITVAIFVFFPRSSSGPKGGPGSQPDLGPSPPSSNQALTPANQPLHILIPATKPDVNLCKLTFSAAILDYPPPVIIAWNQSIDPDKQEGLWGGGTHLFKISKVLEWLTNLTPDHDDDLVMMMDGYDIWFQLRKELLIERYYQINAEANRRIQKRMGRAAMVEDIRQTIIFGSGKRCFPNEIHTVACWPLPPSPLPKDMYFGNTDGTIGSMPNQWSATRQRFLNSGTIMGPAKDMRALFARAAALIEELGQDPEPDDNGSRWSEKIYHSSDQSVFGKILGEQEYQREVMRIRHISWLTSPILRLQQALGADLSDTTDTLEGNKIGNVLDPPWNHANITHRPGKPLEFGIGLDYWQLLAFQTANSERNGDWMTYNKPLEGQARNRGRWDCKPHLRPLSADILNASPPVIGDDGSAPDSSALTTTSWDVVPLYTNICVGTVPVMVHLNGNKQARDKDWNKMWYQPYAAKLAKATPERQADPLIKGGKGRQNLGPGSGFADTGEVLKFEDICKDWDYQ